MQVNPATHNLEADDSAGSQTAVAGPVPRSALASGPVFSGECIDSLMELVDGTVAKVPFRRCVICNFHVVLDRGDKRLSGFVGQMLLQGIMRVPVHDDCAEEFHRKNAAAHDYLNEGE